MSEDLTGKSVVITGASRGIGFGIAQGFAKAGARLTLIADDPKVGAAAGSIGATGVVADITRVGEWSHECTGATWRAGATGATPGAQFRGRNRTGLIRWGRRCEIVTAERRELVWRTVPTLLFPDSVEWTIRLHQADGGTRIEQTFHVLKIPKILDVFYATIIPGHRDRADALTEDLLRLGAVAADIQDEARADQRAAITSHMADPT